MDEKKQLELYLHIPFCEKKCSYCDFLSAPADEDMKHKYILALQQEIRRQGEVYSDYSVPSVFIGGGTPSVFAGNVISELMKTLQNSFSIEPEAEITIECNPGTLNREKAIHYKAAGINRVSLGLQSARADELHLLGRIHTYPQFLESYDILRKAGFDNLNVDLMSGLPGQNLLHWKDTLKKVTALKPEHISAYSLIIEKGTPFYEQFSEDEVRRAAGETPQLLPSEEEERAMYEFTRDFLKEHGYLQYEISNYARPGRECRHNIGYWRRTNYLGLGLGSASLVENRRFSNTRKLSEYLTGCGAMQDYQQLSRQEQMEEFMFLGLRMLSGVSLKEFSETFGIALDGVYGSEVEQLCRQGLLRKREGHLSLTADGISISNYVMSFFIK